MSSRPVSGSGSIRISFALMDWIRIHILSKCWIWIRINNKQIHNKASHLVKDFTTSNKRKKLNTEAVKTIVSWARQDKKASRAEYTVIDTWTIKQAKQWNTDFAKGFKRVSLFEIRLFAMWSGAPRKYKRKLHTLGRNLSTVYVPWKSRFCVYSLFFKSM